MLQSTLTILVTVAVVAIGAAYLTSDELLAVVAGLVGVFAAGLAALGFQNVEVASGGSILSVAAYPALSLLALALALAALVPVWYGYASLTAETRDSNLPTLEEM